MVIFISIYIVKVGTGKLLLLLVIFISIYIVSRDR